MLYGIWHLDFSKRPEGTKVLIAEGNCAVLEDLLNLYEELEGNDDRYFWKSLIERYPLDDSLVRYLVTQICSSEMDPNGTEFWANLGEGRKEVERSQPIMPSNQLEKLLPLTDALTKLMENNAIPTTLKYLVCTHLYKYHWATGMKLFNQCLSACGNETATPVDIDALEAAVLRSRYWLGKGKFEVAAATEKIDTSTKKKADNVDPQGVPLLEWK
jgi:hypothetical protein